MQKTRIWDLPTRLFHWVLAVAVVASIVSAKVGGNAMELHLRLGLLVFALLVFRLLWGLVGGYWSRFAHFVPTPARLHAYLTGRIKGTDHPGHNPLGALSVLAMLLILALQVGSGLFTDDEIYYAGPLTAKVSNATVALASQYHAECGPWLIIGLVTLHVLAIAWYLLRRQNLVRPMIVGDKFVPSGITASRDSWRTRLLALLLLAASLGLVIAVVQWGQATPFG